MSEQGEIYELRHIRKLLAEILHEIKGHRGALGIRIVLGPVRDLPERPEAQGGKMATTPFTLRTRQGVGIKYQFPDAAGVDESADVDPSAITVEIDRPELLALGKDPDGNDELQSNTQTGTVLVTIHATDKQGTVLPVAVQEIDILERTVEPVQIVPVLGSVRDLP